MKRVKPPASAAQTEAGNNARCGCAVQLKNRKAVAVDPEIKTSNLKRLRRIEGQIRGLQKMVEDERYCTDIVIQISSVQEALRSVGRALLQNHLHHCAAQAMQSGDEQQSSAMYKELLELVYKHLR